MASQQTVTQETEIHRASVKHKQHALAAGRRNIPGVHARAVVRRKVEILELEGVRLRRIEPSRVRELEGQVGAGPPEQRDNRKHCKDRADSDRTQYPDSPGGHVSNLCNVGMV